MTTIRSPEQQLDGLAARQHGVIAHRQALRAGLSQHQIDHRVRHGPWRRAALATYVVAGSPDTWRRRAWVAALAYGDGAVLSHVTAGAIHGLCTASPLPH